MEVWDLIDLRSQPVCSGSNRWWDARQEELAMACRGGRAQPVIFWVVLIMLCATFLFSVVTLMQKQCISHCSHCVKAYILCGVITCLSHVCLGKLGITFFFQGIISKLVCHMDGWFIPLAITLIISFFNSQFNNKIP